MDCSVALLGIAVTVTLYGLNLMRQAKDVEHKVVEDIERFWREAWERREGTPQNINVSSYAQRLQSQPGPYVSEIALRKVLKRWQKKGYGKMSKDRLTFEFSNSFEVLLLTPRELGTLPP